MMTSESSSKKVTLKQPHDNLFSTMKQIAAVVMPDMLLELAQREGLDKDTALGVLLCDSDELQNEQVEADAILDAVDMRCRNLGIEAGSSVLQARAKVAKLHIHCLSHKTLQQRLKAIADIAMDYSPVVQIEGHDMVLADVTGSAHLFGGLHALGQQLHQQLAALGHHNRLCIASGPRIAACIARYSHSPVSIVAEEHQKELLSPLPIEALGMHQRLVSWLQRLGIKQIGQLLTLPPKQLTTRIGPQASDWLQLAAGKDNQLLTPYVPEASLQESMVLQHPVYHTKSLVFYIHRAALRLSHRLQARQLVMTSLQLTLGLDRSIARLHGCASCVTWQMHMPMGVARAEQLVHGIDARMQRLQLQAPVIRLCLRATSYSRKPKHQFGLGTAASHHSQQNEHLAVLLAELTAEIGSANVGTFSYTSSHCPEKLTRLTPLSQLTVYQEPIQPPNDIHPTTIQQHPTRLLQTPLRLPCDLLKRGSFATLKWDTYAESSYHRSCQCKPHRQPWRAKVADIHFDHRLDQVDWWKPLQLSRDYYRLWIKSIEHDEAYHLAGQPAASANTGAEAWIFRNRDTGDLWLHGWFD